MPTDARLYPAWVNRLRWPCLMNGIAWEDLSRMGDGPGKWPPSADRILFERIVGVVAARYLLKAGARVSGGSSMWLRVRIAERAKSTQSETYNRGFNIVEESTVNTSYCPTLARMILFIWRRLRASQEHLPEGMEKIPAWRAEVSCNDHIEFTFRSPWCVMCHRS
jgi:hypothetical protein